MATLALLRLQQVPSARFIRRFAPRAAELWSGLLITWLLLVTVSVSALNGTQETVVMAALLALTACANVVQLPQRLSHLLVLTGVALAVATAFGGTATTGEALLAATVGVVGLVATAGLGRLSGKALRDLRARLLAQELLTVDMEPHDPDTGLPKPHLMDQTLVAEVERARRYHRALSIALVAPDDWDAVVEAVGPEEATRTLGRMAQAIIGNLRLVDKIYRYGRAGFAAILPETPPEGAEAAAERLVRALQQEVGLPVRASTASFSPNSPNAASDSLISEAEEGLALARILDLPLVQRGQLAPAAQESSAA